MLEVAGQRVLRVAMHGWQRDEQGQSVTTWTCALQVAWIYQQAGVEWALVDGSVGGIQQPRSAGAPLPPWSVVITDDPPWTRVIQKTMPVDGDAEIMPGLQVLALPSHTVGFHATLWLDTLAIPPNPEAARRLRSVFDRARSALLERQRSANL